MTRQRLKVLPPPPTRKRAQTVARLIEGATAVIAEKGFQRASLEEIAARAGLTKGAIYSNFGSKEELFLAVSASKPLQIRVATNPRLSVAENLRIIGQDCAAVLPAARAHAAFVAEFLLYALTHEDMRERVAASYRERLAVQPSEAFENHLKAAGLPPAQSLAVILQALSLGLAMQHALTPDLVTEEVVIAAFEALA
jgi:AcrR family transcriptional regulator